MLSDIVNAIISAWHFFIHTIQGMFTLAVVGINSLGIVQEVLNWLPSIFTGFCMLTILVLLVKLFLGRS